MIGVLIVAGGTAAALWTIAAALYWLIKPGEDDPQHPKRLILRDDR